jgi:hypothetical protein
MFNLFIQKAYAQAGQNIGIPLPGTTCNGTGPYALPQYIGCVYKEAIFLAIGLSILMFIWAGYNYMNSQGNPDTIAVAKDMIYGTIIGLLVLALGYLILSSVGSGIVSVGS